MRVVFAGTPPFAARALDALLDAGHEVVLVLTQPDRPSGRGLKLTPSPVALAAQEHAIPVEKYASLKAPEAQQRLRGALADVMVVAAYGLILPRAVLEIPGSGCLNIHASLLPRWRGAAPIQRAILAGDAQSGISIMLMDEGLDTGPVVLQRSVPIGPRETTGQLTEKLALLGAQCMVEALVGLQARVPKAQDGTCATHAAKITKAEAGLDWSMSSTELDRRVRAFNPTPGAEAVLGSERVKVWEAEPVGGDLGIPGSLVRGASGELLVACGQGGLRLQVVQRAGGRRMAMADFLRGNPLDFTATAKSPKSATD